MAHFFRNVLILLVGGWFFAGWGSALALPAPGPLALVRSAGITVPVLSCGATPVPGGTCCPGLTSLDGFVASGGLALDMVRGRLYAADFEDNRVQVFDTQTLSWVKTLSALGSAGALNLPVDEALDADGNLYVADLGNLAVEKFDANYNFIGTLAAGRGLSVVGVWADGSSVYLATMQNYIYRYEGNGASYSATATFGGPAYLNHPNEMIKVGDWLYVTDTYNNRVVKFSVNNPSAAPVIVQSCLLIPTGIRQDPAGNFLVEESNNGSYPAYVDSFNPDFTTLKSRCTFQDTWSAVMDLSGKTYVSGMNSLSVTVLQSCFAATASPTPAPPSLTPTPLPPTFTPTVTATPRARSAAAPVVAAPNISTGGEPIRFQVHLTGPAMIRLSLFSLNGELVYQTQVMGQAGANNLVWSLGNKSGLPVASGLYLYLVQITGPSGSSLQRGKVIVMH